MDVTQTRPGLGWIEVIAGSMFSGKSEELIRRLRREQIARRTVQIFKPKVDDRYSGDHIISHSDMRIASENVSSSRELLVRVRPETEVVGIDEGQFFDQELPAVCWRSPNTSPRPWRSAWSAAPPPTTPSAWSPAANGCWLGPRGPTKRAAAGASIRCWGAS